MSADLQNRDMAGEIGRILRDSRERWLSHDELLILFRHHRRFPLSLNVPGPEPRRPGLFLFDEYRYSDNYVWDRVPQAKRLNCASGVFPDGSVVTFTVAKRKFQGGGAFFRRTHHARDVHPTFAFVHYRLVDEVSDDSSSYSSDLSSQESSDSSEHSSDPDYVPEDTLPLHKSPKVARTRIHLDYHHVYPQVIKQHFGPKLLEHFTLQVKQDPQNPKVYTDRAVCYLKLGMLIKALRDANKALEIEPKCVEGFMMKGQVETLLRDYVTAIQSFGLGLAVDPNNKSISRCLRSCRKKAQADID